MANGIFGEANLMSRTKESTDDNKSDVEAKK